MLDPDKLERAICVLARVIREDVRLDMNSRPEAARRGRNSLWQLYHSIDAGEKWTSMFRRAAADLPDDALRLDPDSPAWEQSKAAFLKRLEPLGRGEGLQHLFEYPDSSWQETPRVMFRVSGEESYTVYKESVGFLSARVISQGPGADFECSPWEDYVAHIDGKRRDLTSGGKFESPYVSLSESPYRTLRFATSDNFKTRAKTRVFAIDAMKLKSQVNLARSSGIYVDFLPLLGTYDSELIPPSQYALPSHWLARGWVPSDCIVKQFSVDEFESLCASNGIVVDEERPNHGKAEKRLSMEVVCGRPRRTEREVMAEMTRLYREARANMEAEMESEDD